MKGIGRIRARALYNENLKTINDLRGIPLKRLSKIKTIGEGIAKNIKNQIGESNIFNDNIITEFE